MKVHVSSMNCQTSLNIVFSNASFWHFIKATAYQLDLQAFISFCLKVPFLTYRRSWGVIYDLRVGKKPIFYPGSTVQSQISVIKFYKNDQWTGPYRSYTDIGIPGLKLHKFAIVVQVITAALNHPHIMLHSSSHKIHHDWEEARL